MTQCQPAYGGGRANVFLSFELQSAAAGDRTLKLTPEEATTMQALGFRFAEYAPEHDRCRLSSPFRLFIIPGKDELTIEQ